MDCIVTGRWLKIVDRPVSALRGNDSNRQVDVVRSEATVSVIVLLLSANVVQSGTRDLPLVVADQQTSGSEERLHNEV